MALSLAEGIGEGGHRKTTRPEEYVRVTKVQPDPAQPILRYDLDVGEPGHHPGGPVPILVNPWTGEQETPPRTISIPRGTADNPVGEEEHVFAQGGHQQRIWFSERHAMVNRWRTVLAAPYNIDLEWLAENGPVGFGQSLGGAEWVWEYKATPAENRRNPTHGGSLVEPRDPTPEPEDELVISPSVRIYSNITDEYLEGAVIPLHFVNQTAAQYHPHNTDATHGALFWRHKHYERVEPFFEGSPFLSRITKLYYQPRAWRESDMEEPPLIRRTASKLISNNSCICVLQDENGFDEGWYADLENDTVLRNFEDSLPGFPPITFDRPEVQKWTMRQIWTEYVGPDFSATVAPFIPSGYGVTVKSRSSDGFAVGYGSSVSEEGLARVEFLRMQNHTSQQTRVAGIPVPNHEHAGGCHIVTGSGDATGHHSDEREAGWIGYHSYLYTGPLDQVLATMRSIKGLMRQVPDARTMLPSIVREGTDIADERVAVEPPLQQIRLNPQGAFSARLR
jgi:hypothetical protein